MGRAGVRGTVTQRRAWAGQGTAASRGYGSSWRKIRLAVLARDMGLCQPCRRKGRVTAASAVHHIKAKAQGGTDDLDNLEAICDPCHEAADAANRGYRKPRAVGLDGYPLDFTADGLPVWDD